MNPFNPFNLWFRYGALVGALTLSACCINERCECAGQSTADAFWFRFALDTPDQPNPEGFTAAEIDTVWLVRDPLDTANRAHPDSVRVVPGADGIFRLDQTQPFALNPLKPSGYAYGIHEYGDNPAFYFRLVSIGLTGSYVTTSPCCTCYQNTRKEARLGRGRLLDLRNPAPDQPVYIDLRK